MVSYYNNLPSESIEWEILRSVILSGKYEALPKMVEDGYAVSFALLEILYRLGQEDIIRQICDKALKFDDTARKFFQMHVGYEVTSVLVDKAQKRRELHKQRIEQHRQEKVCQKKQQDEEKIKELFEHGDTDALIQYVSTCNRWKYLVSLTGEEWLYSALEKYWKWNLDDCPALLTFSEQFLMKHKVYSFLIRFSSRFGGDDAVCSKISKTEGGIDYLYNYGTRSVDGWLIENGYSELFKTSGTCGYLRLSLHKELNMEDYKAWYALDPDKTVKYLEKCDKFMLYRVKIASWFKK